MKLFEIIMIGPLVVYSSLVGQQAVIKTGTRLVVIDVTALDRDGHPVHGLGCKDFRLEETRILQSLQRCDEHRFGSTNATAQHPSGDLPVNVFSNQVDAPLPGTLDVVLVDFLNAEPVTRSALKQVARDLIRTAAPGHRMAVFALGQNLTLLSGFTDDLRRFQMAQMQPGTLTGATSMGADLANGLSPSHAPVIPASEELIGGLASRFMRDRVDVTLEGLRGINRYVAGLPGRKKLIWITSSFPNVFQPHRDTGSSVGPGSGVSQLDDMTVFQPQIEEVSRELAANRIAIYPVDVRGVRDLSRVDASQSSIGIQTQPDLIRNQASAARSAEIDERGTLDTLAAETGGHAFYGDNDVNRMVRKALDAGNDFYTLSYRPSNNADDGRFRSFRITTDVVGAKLLYRRGYVAPGRNAAAAPVAAATGTSEASYAMKRGLPYTAAILFYAGLHKDGAPRPIVSGDKKSKRLEQQYRIDYTVDPADLVWTTVGAEHTAEVTLLLAAYDSMGGTLGQAKHPVQLRINETQYEVALRKGLHLRESILLPAGKEAFVRLGVLDPGSGREGTLEIPLSVLRAESKRPTAS